MRFYDVYIMTDIRAISRVLVSSVQRLERSDADVPICILI